MLDSFVDFIRVVLGALILLVVILLFVPVFSKVTYKMLYESHVIESINRVNSSGSY